MTFESEVEADRDSFFRGQCVQLQYGRTPTGQQFATIITHGLWYAHATWDGAKGKVAEYRRQLEAGDYKAFLCNLPPEKRYQRNIVSALIRHFSEGTFETRDFSSTKIIKTTPSDCANNPDSYLQRGDIVQTNFILVANHEGIYIGNGKVIHVSGHGGGKTASVAREGRLLGDFVSDTDNAIRVLVLRVRFRTPEEIAKQAEAYRDQKFRAGEYDLFVKNCQHFAALCAFGVEYSGDIERLGSNFNQLAMAARSFFS
uniref:LRAT domain-containing protein n=1 Tax=Plectus sambesii TaxID=2011161 RepID=A0A914WPN1_9BILA